jgi:hypothetical protein
MTMSGCTSPTPAPTQSPTADPTAAPTATPTATTQATPTAAPANEKTWDNGNIYTISGAVKNPTEVTFDTQVYITYMDTYHWNGAKGATPGTIALKASDGTTYGPWQAEGANGQGGVKNAYWITYPNATIPAGKYTVVDSDPSTWATNSYANYVGMARIKYIPA